MPPDAGGPLATTRTDFEELPNGRQFVYWTTSDHDGDTSRPSIPAIVWAQNDPPAAVNDSVPSPFDPLVLEDTFVIIDPVANDTDADTADNLDLRLASVSNEQGGAAVPQGDMRSVLFTLAANVNSNNTGAIGFDNQTNNGFWSGDPSIPMSGNSNTATVDITVTPVNDEPSFTAAAANQTVLEDAGPQTVPAWATDITAGPMESEQTVQFIVTGNTNAVLFSAQPAVSPTGVLTYTPAANQHGVANVTLVLMDGAGTLYGGDDTSAPLVFTITVTSVNDPPAGTENDEPAGTDNSVTILADKVFAVSDFGFTDPFDFPPDTFEAVKITTLPPASAGVLLYQSEPVVEDELINVAADIDMGHLTLSPAEGGSGSFSFTFQVQDDGGLANGGMDLDSSPNTMTLHLVPLDFVATTVANCIAGDTPRVTVDENSIIMGLVGSELDVLDTCVHGASVQLPAFNGAQNAYEVTLAYDLFTWDSYNASSLPGSTGYWDSFSVTVSKAPYADLDISESLGDPITAGQAGGDLTGVGFIWGGSLYGDGMLDECHSSGTCLGGVVTTTLEIPGNTDAGGDSYLNVVLDTKTPPDANHNYTSYGTILDIVPVQLEEE